MIKKIGFLVTLMMSVSVMAADIQLPPPNITEEMSLKEALENRHSDHAFADKELSQQDLSNVLWVAYGVNRADGKRTIPTARDQKELEVYLFNKNGIYRYDADENVLRQVSEENKLELFQKQDYMKTVSAVLVYVGGPADYSAMHAGSAYQNVNLYTATNQMASIVRGMFDQEAVQRVLNLQAEQRVLISQALGYKE